MAGHDRIRSHLRSRASSDHSIRAVGLGLPDLTRDAARGVEQALIEYHGLQSSGGTLMNEINSIALSNPSYGALVEQGEDLLNTIGYPGF